MLTNKVQKRVRFAAAIVVVETYSSEDYDRLQIESILYRRCYNRVSTADWIQVFVDLDAYKLNEMLVHKSSIKNIKWHS